MMTRYQDDFYEAVNGKWAETAVIQMISHGRVVYGFGR